MVKNILSNYAGRLWSLISVYLFIPMYIKLLGVEAYGIISFYAVLLSVLMFADVGLSATLNREFSRPGEEEYKQTLLYSIERLYVVISLVIAVFVLFAAPFIADQFFHESEISAEQIILSIRLMGVGIALQFYSTLHNSGLMGLQLQVMANAIQVSWSMLRSGVVVLVLYFYPKIEVFFYWQLLSNLLLFITNRTLLWKAIRTSFAPVFNLQLLKQLSPFALGMMLMSVVAALNGQLDKLVVSKFMTLKQYSYYALAGSMAQVVIIAINPITASVLPMLSRSHHEGNTSELKRLYHEYAYLIAFGSSLAGALLLGYPHQLVMLWTDNALIATNTATLIQLLGLGSIFLANQYMPYLLSISGGHTKTNLVIGIASIGLLVPLLYFCINRFGFEGAAIPFVITNLIALMVLGYLILKRFIPGIFARWLCVDLGVPLATNVILLLVIRFAVDSMELSIPIWLEWSVFVLVSVVLNWRFFNIFNPENTFKGLLAKLIRRK